MIAVIRILRRGNKEPEAVVTIPGPRENSFYWWYGPSWNSEPYEIVYTYPDDTDSDVITLHFYKTFNVPQPVKPDMQSAGWLSPDGKWFICRPWEHDSLAEHLAAIYHNVSAMATRVLEKMNWLRIHKDGIVGNGPAKTQMQIDTLHDLILCSEDTVWRRYLGYAITLADI